MDKFRLRDYKLVAIPFTVNEKLSKIDGSEMADESLYMKIVGSLLYLTITRPDIMFAVGLLARFMHNLTRKHLETAKKALIDIQGTSEHRIAYEKGNNAMLIGYYDTDWAESDDEMINTFIYAFSLGSVVFS